MKFDVFGLGNPLIDILIHIEDDLLKELNLIKGSMNLVEHETRELILNKCAGLKRLSSPGGSSANTMVMITQLGGTAGFCGKLGSDEFGLEYEKKIKELGVHSFLKYKDGPSGSSIILVTPDANRTMNTFLGMCEHMSKNALPEEAIKSSQFLFIEGYLWDTPSQKEAVIAAIDIANKAGVKVVFSLADPFCVERHKQEFLELVSGKIDLLFCNQLEAEHLVYDFDVNKSLLDQTVNLIQAEEYENPLLQTRYDPEETLQKLGKLANHIVLTRGKRGAKILYHGITTDIKAFTVKATDCTGTGDAFVAGYLFGLSKSYTIAQAGQLASYCAAAIATQDGSRFRGDLRDKVKQYLV